MTGGARAARGLAVAWLVATALRPGVAAASPPSLPPALEAALRAGIERNFAGDWDGAAQRFEAARRIAPDHPAPAFFAVTTLFWRIELDPTQTHLDAAIEAGLEEALALADRRLDARPDDVEALSWAGQALSYASRRDAQRSRFFAAGTKGEQARKRFERALALTPGYVEPKAPLGAYLYVSAQLPRALSWLDFLWFVPKGDAPRGLALLEEAAAGEGLGRLGAQYTLLRLYARFEPARRTRAMALGDALRARFPENALLDLEQLRLLAETGATERALAEGDRVRARVEAGVRTYDTRVGVAARLWQARAALLGGRLGEAEERLAALPEAELATLSWAGAWHGLTVGQLHDARGARDPARQAYERVADLDGREREPQAATMARAYLETPWTLPVPAVRGRAEPALRG